MRISDWSSDVCSSDLLARRSSHECEVGAEPLLVKDNTDIRPRVNIVEQVEINGLERHYDATLAGGTDLLQKRLVGRSEYRRVGKAWFRPCRPRVSPSI